MRSQACCSFPAVAAALLAALPDYRITARLNVVATMLTFLCALSLFLQRPRAGSYLLIDDLNVIFIVLDDVRRLHHQRVQRELYRPRAGDRPPDPAVLRFYHAMYQVLMFAMNLALVANNIGLMWVAIELATLTTVLMVGIYRTHEALEAAWKYFILGSVGIALALFGTILVYMAARPVRRRGSRRPWSGPFWSSAPAVSIRRCSTSPLSSCCSATAPRSGSRRCMPGCPTRTPKARRRSRPCCRGCCSMSRSMRCCASRCCWRRIPAALAPGPLMVTMGLISLVFAAFMLYRRRDIKRMFAYSSIEHMGIITFAFGMGGPLANFAGLLHMTMH